MLPREWAPHAALRNRELGLGRAARVAMRRTRQVHYMGMDYMGMGTVHSKSALPRAYLCAAVVQR